MDPVANFILHSRYKTIKGLVTWMQSGLRKGECVKVYQWMGVRWYIEVVDEPLKDSLVGIEKTKAMRLGFTVDLSKDTILWNHQGGNCWVRDRHWFRLFMERFPKHVVDYKSANKHLSLYKFTPRKPRQFA